MHVLETGQECETEAAQMEHQRLEAERNRP